MFTFHWSELLVVIVGGLVLLFGLALLMLRRRQEILEKFLTPEDSNLEEDFFRVREPTIKAPPEEENTGTETSDAAEALQEETAQWGGVSD